MKEEEAAVAAAASGGACGEAGAAADCTDLCTGKITDNSTTASESDAAAVAMSPLVLWDGSSEEREWVLEPGPEPVTPAGRRAAACSAPSFKRRLGEVQWACVPLPPPFPVGLVVAVWRQ